MCVSREPPWNTGTGSDSSGTYPDTESFWSSCLRDRQWVSLVGNRVYEHITSPITVCLTKTVTFQGHVPRHARKCLLTSINKNLLMPISTQTVCRASLFSDNGLIVCLNPHVTPLCLPFHLVVAYSSTISLSNLILPFLVRHFCLLLFIALFVILFISPTVSLAQTSRYIGQWGHAEIFESEQNHVVQKSVLEEAEILLGSPYSHMGSYEGPIWINGRMFMGVVARQIIFMLFNGWSVGVFISV